MARFARYNIICDKVCRWLATGQRFSPDTLVSSTDKTDCRDITELLLKVVLNTLTLTQMLIYFFHCDYKISLWFLLINTIIRNPTFFPLFCFLHLSVERRWGMATGEAEAMYFLVNYTLNLSYIYPIFSCKKILYSDIIFVRSGLTPCILKITFNFKMHLIL